MLELTPTSMGDGTPKRRLTLLLAFAIITSLLALAGTAQAAKVPVVAAGDGLSLPAGVAVTPNGSVWVTDGEQGICRVEAAATPKLVESPYCLPHVEGGPEPLGPSGSLQMAFDAVSSNFFVAEGTSKGSGVWRMHYDSVTDTIDSHVRVVSTGENRLTGLALSPDGHVDFSGRDDQAIRRLPNAGTAAPGTPTPVVGTTQGTDSAQLANLGGALYIAEPTGVTRIATPGVGNTTAVPVPGFPGGSAMTVAADPLNNVVYAGTANLNGVDQVDVLKPGDVVETYETGFAFATAMGVAPDGTLYVADDPLTSNGGAESIGQSRLFSVPPQLSGLPTVTFTGGPAVYSNLTSGTFTFTSDGGAIECRFGAAAFAPCPTGEFAFGPLADGTYSFEARAAAAGRIARRTFTVDTVAPTVENDNASGDRTIESDRLKVRFSASELFVQFTCTVDGQDVFGCEPPIDLRDIAIGEHVVTAFATDLAGNVGPSTSWRFTRVARPVTTPQDNSGSGSGSGSGASDGGSFAPSSVPAECRRVARQRARGSYTLSAARRLSARLRPPSAARYAKLTLRKVSSRTRGTAVLNVATRALPSSATKRRSLAVTLSRKHASLLRSGKYRMAVAYGTCPRLVGAWTELSKARKSTAKKSSEAG